MRDRLNYLGGGATVVGLLCLMATRLWPDTGWLVTAGEVLCLSGVALLAVRLWKHGL